MHRVNKTLLVVSTAILAITAPGAARTQALYVSSGADTISRILPDGSTSTYASGFTAADGIAFGSTDNLFVTDQANPASQLGPTTIRRIDTTGNTTAFATVDGGAGDLAFDSAGNLYAADYSVGPRSVMENGGFRAP